jgi:hypothetical protein
MLKTFRVLILVIFFARVLFGNVSVPGNFWWIDYVAVAAIIFFLMLHLDAVLKVLRRRAVAIARRPRWEGDPNNDTYEDLQCRRLIPLPDFDLLRPRLRKEKNVLWASRLSRVQLLWCIPLAVSALLLLWIALYLSIARPSVVIPVPMHRIHLNIWWPVAWAGFFAAYKVVDLWQQWKYDPVIVLTDRQLIPAHIESALLPEEGKDDKGIISTAQITEVEVFVGRFGGQFGGFGTVRYKVVAAASDDKGAWRTLKYMPRAEEFVELLRSVSPAGGMAPGQALLSTGQQVGASYDSESAPSEDSALIRHADAVRRAAQQAGEQSQQ